MIYRIFPDKKNIFILLALIMLPSLFLLFSCEDKGALEASKELNLTVPESAEITVSDVRVKGLTLSWTEPNSGYYEYAIAASFKGGIDTYEEALQNDYVVLNFTPNNLLKGSYKIKGLIGGKDYEIKLFIRGKNTKSQNYLGAKAYLPYIDEAELTNLEIVGLETIYDKLSDSFYSYYLDYFTPAELKFTYKTAHNCSLYIEGEKVEENEVVFKAGETVYLTVVNNRTLAARDYEVSVKAIDNGIPTVIIETDNGRSIVRQDQYSSASLKIMESKDNPLGIGLYEGKINIKGRGNSSFGMPKKGYNFSIPEDMEDVQLLDMAPGEDWLLLANFSDKSLMRNYTAFELYRDMGAPFSAKLRFVDLIFNGEYMGTYNLGERIKIDKGRLNIDKLKIDTPEDQLTGGYILEVNSADKHDSSEIIFETKKIKWSRGHFWSIKAPAEKNLSDAAYEYIKNYVNEAEDALFSDNFTDPKTGYRAYIDTASVIDWLIVNEVFKQVDANFHTSTYFYKPRDGKLHMGPVWDFDLGGGNADYSGCDNPEGWYVMYADWIYRMLEDESFTKELITRWNQIKKSTIFENTFKRIDETAKMIDRSQQMNFAKWPILGVYVWPNAGEWYLRTTYQDEIDYLKEWLTLRIEWMDNELNNNMAVFYNN